MSTTSIADALTGGDPRSLGRTEEVVQWVLARAGLLQELFACVLHPDPIVRMRASDALEKVCRKQPDWLVPYVARLLGEVAAVAQPSVQWHLAQMLNEIPLQPEQQAKAIRVLKRNLTTSSDWIVLNLTLETLAELASRDAALGQEFPHILKGFVNHPLKSVAKRAAKLMGRFGK